MHVASTHNFSNVLIIIRFRPKIAHIRTGPLLGVYDGRRVIYSFENMGKLLALELFNFKSYKGHHVLHFGDSYFTSIIGPNGSGKSNSMDAISFVLGIKSSHLRSTHLKDLVYRGRVLKHSKINADGTATEGVNGNVDGDAEPGASDHEADTQTSTQRNDPQTAWVMAVYEDDAGDEQQWKRSITSSGASEYRINNRVVNAKQYNESLEAENILIKARNFLVFQGDVEAIASQNARDLTRLIEQISGSLEYKAEYERLRTEKEKADEEQNYRLQQRRGINGEIKAFREQKEELHRFENTRDAKDAAVVTHILWKLHHLQRTIEDSTQQIQRHQDELQEYRRSVKKHETRLEAAKREQAKALKNVSKVEREIKRREKNIEEKENGIVPIDSKLETLSQQLQVYDKRMSEIAGDRDSQEQAAKKLQEQLSTVQKAQQRWQEAWRMQQREAGQELDEQDLQEYQRLRAEVYKRSGGDQIKVDNITRQLNTDEETVNSLKTKLESTQTLVDALSAEIDSLDERKVAGSQTIKSTKKEVDAKKAAINAIVSDKERSNQKRRELDEKLHDVLRRLLDAQGVQRESQKEARQRETVAQMKRIFPGVKGMVHGLCKPKQKKYETAVATALGRNWDSVVVDSEKTAKECIQYLKDQRAGQYTFIPLDTIIHQQPNANLRGMHQGMRLAIDTIDYDAGLERAMSYACGNAIVTDTLAIARHLCYERNVDAKAVSLDGTVIHKGGNMTGGESVSDRKRRFEDGEVENLRALAEKFKGELEALPKGHKRQAEEEQLHSELTGLQDRLAYANDEVKAVDRNMESKNKELKHATSELGEFRAKHEEHFGGVETLRQQLEGFQGGIKEVEDKIFGDFCKRLGYSSIREYEKQQGSLQQEAKVKKHDFQQQVNRLQYQLDFETQRLQSTRERLATAQRKSTQEQALVTQLEAEELALERERDDLTAQIEKLNTQLAAARAEGDECNEKVIEARREVQKRSKSVEKTLKEISELETEIQQASTGRYGVLRQCKVDNIDIPLEPDSRKLSALPLEDAVLEETVDAMDVDVSSDQPPQYNDYGIRVSFDDLDEDLQEDAEAENGLVEQVAALTSELERMAPNMRSADRLEQTEERLRATEREFTDSRSAARTATRAFETVRSKRADLFNKAFAHISDQIGPVYRELTKTASFPLGGTASLSTEEDDEPYLSGVKYHAMPPLKRFRDMEHLSGGEKTMAALALLFAVHTYAPSPFFVLDEVDAALDHANTMQLAHYVREHAGPGMQFVVISLKTGLFQNSETLVGVLRDQSINSSRALTLDVSFPPVFPSPVAALGRVIGLC